MNEVSCPAPEQRRAYLLEWGGHDLQRWCWACPVCSFRIMERDRSDCEKQMRDHVCSAGWCAVPARVDVVHVTLPASVHERYVSPAQRKRYAVKP